MSVEQEDLDLLLSLDRVVETPPPSPCGITTTTRVPPHSPDYPLSDHEHGSPKPRGKADMSVFRDSVGEHLEDIPTVLDKAPKLKKKSYDTLVERFSGLRIRNLLVSNEELNFADTRFIRLGAIRNSLIGDTISGCWATAGVLTDKGSPKPSSTGKHYCIFKLGCLDENVTSVFLFGDAYTNNCKEAPGTVFALFNAKVRKDAEGNGFSLSVFSSEQIVKMGSSFDYGICKAKRKDGVACNMAINKSRGIYCNYHKSNASQKYSVTRTELKGGNLRTAFRDNHRSEGIYMVDPLAQRTNLKKSTQPLKLLSVDGLKKALSNAGKVTSNARSQGIRFLTEITEPKCSKYPSKVSTLLNKEIHCSGKRLSPSVKPTSTNVSNRQSDQKKRKTEQPAEKMIEIEIFSSDGE